MAIAWLRVHAIVPVVPDRLFAVYVMHPWRVNGWAGSIALYEMGRPTEIPPT